MSHCRVYRWQKYTTAKIHQHWSVCCGNQAIIITSVQNNLIQGPIVAADRRFNGIRRVAPVCTLMRAHWRHLANTIELVLPSAHPSPQSKRQIDRFSRFCTAHGKKSYSLLYNWRLFPQKLPLLMGIWTPSNTLFLGPIRAHNPNGILIGS